MRIQQEQTQEMEISNNCILCYLCSLLFNVLKKHTISFFVVTFVSFVVHLPN
jgi:hypothetical protein